MELDIVRFAADFYRNLLNAELYFNEWAQERLSAVEPLWRFISVYLDSGNLMNIFIPLAGIYHQEVLTHLVVVVSLISALNSFEKWVYPELRPLWWLRELYANERAMKPQVALRGYDLSCDSSGGMPCSHSMSFTVFMLVLTSYLFVYCHNRFKCWRSNTWRVIAYGLIAICVLFVWMSRIYFATEFLHQCVLGSYFAIRALNAFERRTEYLYSLKRSWALLCVLGFCCIAVCVYFGKLHFGIDPHWSVRQAFKWCAEPAYLRHETSPVFMLARDLGSLMGIAIASPLSSIKSNNTSFWRRLVAISGLELINFILRGNTPKQHGRFVFVAYEFTRNAIHSLILVKFLAKLK